MVTHVKMTGNHQIFRAALCAVFLMLAAWPARGQELRGASSTLAGKIGESGRKRVAVVDFTDLQGNVTELGRYLAEELSGALVNDARGFRVIDRAHLKSILQEHKLAATGLIDPETARQLGKIAGVDTLVTGTITSAFGDTVRVMVKALDVSTAEIIGQATADIPKTEAIKTLLGQGIATASRGPGGSSGGAGNPQPPKEPKLLVVSVEENDVLFVVKSCKRSGETLNCTGSLTNKAHVRRQVILQEVSFVDNLGNAYRGRAKTGQTELEPALPVNFLVGAQQTDPTATRITLIISYWVEGFNGKVTLRNIQVNVPSEAAPGESEPVKNQGGPAGKTTRRFYFRHRHRGLARGNIVTSYCAGELTVTSDGVAQYVCTTPDTLLNRCERTRFSAIKDVQLYDGGLRITLVGGGNWDFFGSPADVQGALGAITPFTVGSRK